jgi:hypothetical protein
MGSTKIRYIEKAVENQNKNDSIVQDAWSLYLYAMKSPVTREKYQKRLEKFFNFINMEGKTVETTKIKYYGTQIPNKPIGFYSF